MFNQETYNSLSSGIYEYCLLKVAKNAKNAKKKV
nr:hypothetical protein [Mucilaginibacter sp. E4BP6]